MRPGVIHEPRIRELPPITSMCIVCHAPAVTIRNGLPLCEACTFAARPHRRADPYDDLGGGD